MTRRKDPAAIRTPLGQMEAAGHHVPAFEPVPRKFRHDGWTPDRQRAFIAALADTGNVMRACERVGMTTVGVYYLRRQPGAESFAAAWRAALAGAAAPAPPDPLPLTLRGLMHILEADARRRAEAGQAEIDPAIIETFAPVP